MQKLTTVTIGAALGACLLVGGCDGGDDTSASGSTTTAVATTTTLDDENPGGPIDTTALADLQSDLPHPGNVSYSGDTITIEMPRGMSDADAEANCESARSFVSGIAPETAVTVTVGGAPIYVFDADSCTKV